MKLMDALKSLEKDDHTQYNLVLKFPITWITVDFIIPPEQKCDCGAVKCNTTHATWCSTNKE